MPVAKEPSFSGAPEYIQKAMPYVPGKPIEAVERELGISGSIKLASNENPFGPSPKALACLQNASDMIRLYPDASHHYLREKLAQRCHVSAEEIIVGNGSNEVLELLVRTFCVPGKHNIVSCGAAFIAYRVSATIHNVEYREANVRDDLVADLDGMLALCDPNTRIVFLPNPNNPTGTFVDKSSLDKFISALQGKDILVVLDSAYHEYVVSENYPNPFDYYKLYPNIVVTRTFSKAFGLGGLRVGYGIAHPQILAAMYKVKMPFNVNSVALAVAHGALDDFAHLQKCVEVNREGVAYFEQEFARLGLRYWPSQGNFVLVDFAKDVQPLFLDLQKAGFITRPVAGFGLKTHLRITTAKPEDNKRFIAVLEKVLGQ